jgi:hypothetical protein
MFVFLIEVECVPSDVGTNSYTCDFVEQRQACNNATWICHAKRWSELWIRNYSVPCYRLLGFVMSNALADIFLNLLAVKGCITSYLSSLSSQHVLYLSDITSMCCIWVISPACVVSEWYHEHVLYLSDITSMCCIWVISPACVVSEWYHQHVLYLISPACVVSEWYHQHAQKAFPLSQKCSKQHSLKTHINRIRRRETKKKCISSKNLNSKPANTVTFSPTKISIKNLK